MQCYKILGRRFTFSFIIFIHSKYYILKLTLCNSDQHRNSDKRVNVSKQMMVVLTENFSSLQKFLAEKTSAGKEICEEQLLVVMFVVVSVPL